MDDQNRKMPASIGERIGFRLQSIGLERLLTPKKYDQLYKNLVNEVEKIVEERQASSERKR